MPTKLQKALYRHDGVFVTGVVVSTFKSLKGIPMAVLEEPTSDGHMYVVHEHRLEYLTFSNNNTTITFSEEGKKM